MFNATLLSPAWPGRFTRVTSTVQLCSGRRSADVSSVFKAPETRREGRGVMLKESGMSEFQTAPPARV